MMWMIILAVALCTLLDLKPLWKNKRYRELYITAGLLTAGIVLGLMKMLKITIPNPVEAIMILFTPSANMMTKWLS